MALEGSIQEFGLADILQLLYLQKKTGILHIKGKTDEVEIFFTEGNISNIHSSKISSFKRLSEIFIKNGIITKNDLALIKDSQKKVDIKAFLTSKLVSADDFLHGMEDLVIDTLVYIFSWKEGMYEFILKKLSDTQPLQSPLDTQQLLMESMRIVDELFLIEGKLDLEVVYTRSEISHKSTLGINESRVFNLIDGKKDVSQLIDTVGMEYLETAKALISLEEKGLVKSITVKPLIGEKIIGTDKRAAFSYVSILIVTFFLISLITFRGLFNLFSALSDADRGANLERARLIVDKYYFQYGEFPQNLSTLSVPLDSWGRPYIYKLTDSGFQLFSAGPDGIEGSDDDIY